MDDELVSQTRHTNTHLQTNNRSLWDKFWRDKEGNIVIAQIPNVWLILWIILEIVSLFSSSHRTELITWWLASAALGIWSLLEIFRGVNYFRRVLGLCVAVLTLLTIVGK
jgi:hypothetical protein